MQALVGFALCSLFYVLQQVVTIAAVRMVVEILQSQRGQGDEAGASSNQQTAICYSPTAILNELDSEDSIGQPLS